MLLVPKAGIRWMAVALATSQIVTALDKEAVIACKNFLKFAAQDEFPSEYESCERFVSSTAF